MKVAIIGGGISGMMVADHLNGKAAYTLYEAGPRLGGHADTQTVMVEGARIAVDTGFIVFNQSVYTHFNRMLEAYKVPSIPTDMSFAVSNRVTGLEYNATSLATLFCQKSNWFKPKFYRMIWDIKRFYAAADQVLAEDNDQSIYEYLVSHHYSDYFINEHIIPMVSALWSGDFQSVKAYPLKYLLRFMKNHQMLQINDRPQWRTIQGGSQQYVTAIADHMQGQVMLNTPVLEVRRDGPQIEVQTATGVELFDQVVFATHSDVSLKLLASPSQSEQTALAGIPYVENHMDLHTDSSILPANKQAWASWSVNKFPDQTAQCTVNYYMNLLQSLPCDQAVIVSLNQNQYLDQQKILLSKTYQHPVYNHQTVESQALLNKIQGQHNTYYCGAYMGWGFHEDGARSGVAVAELIAELC